MDIADDDIQLTKRVEELIERGLSRYGNGDMEGALSEWKHALALDPESERAANYLSYVEDHLDLSANDGDVHSESTVELAYPFGLSLGNESVDEYESFEIVGTDNQESGEDDITKTVRLRAPSEGLDSADDGWSVDEAWVEDLVKKSEAAFAPTARKAPLQPDVPDRAGAARAQAPLVESSFADLDLALAGEDDLEPTQARGSAQGLVDAEIDALGLQAHTGDDAPTIARRSPSQGLRSGDIELSGDEDHTRPGGAAGSSATELGSDAMAAMRKNRAPDFSQPEESTAERSGASAHAFDELELASLEPSEVRRPDIPDAIDDASHPAVSLSLDEDSPAENAMDEELTIDRGGLGALGLVTGLQSATEDSGLLSLAVNIDESSLADQDETREMSLPDSKVAAASVASVSDDVLARVLADAPPGDEGQRTLYVVGRLIEIAQYEFTEGNYAAAAAAATCALERADDSAVAQKAIFENERTIIQILIADLGDLSDIPELLVPLTEIPLDQIDHRAAFLLTRMDGVLSLEEILDVSGMPRMEALRHLSRIHARGFLRVG